MSASSSRTLITLGFALAPKPSVIYPPSPESAPMPIVPILLPEVAVGIGVVISIVTEVFREVRQ